MKVLVAGGNGAIGGTLVKLMNNSPHQALAMLRDPDQAAAAEEHGAQPVIADLEGDCLPALEDCEAVVFAAGSGPHTGPDKTESVDRDGAMRLIDACESTGVKRFIMLSAMRTRTPEQAPEKLQHYLQCKQAADDHLRASGLDWTIAAPGRLNNDAPSGHIAAAEVLPEFGEIPRADVARALLELLDMDHTTGRRIEMISGKTPVHEALAAL